VRGLWVSVFDVFWFLFGVVVLGEVLLASGFLCVCVCVCARVAWCVWCLLEVVILLFCGVLVSGVCACSPPSVVAETCSYFLLLNTIINPYYHSCGFMTDIYLTISIFYTQRGCHTSEVEC